MADLAALQQAMLRNKQSTANLVGLDEKYDRATALRDQDMPEINRFGTVSPLSVISNVMNNTEGQKRVGTLDPQRVSARDDIATGAAEIENYALENTMAKRAEEALRATEQTTAAGEASTRAEEDTAEHVLGLTLKKKKDIREEADLVRATNEQARKERERDGDSLVYTDGKKGRMAVTTDADGNLVQAAGPNAGQPIPEGWYEDENSYMRGGRGKSWTEGQKAAFNNDVQSVTNIRRNKEAFNDMFAKPTNMPSKTAQEWAGIAAKGDWLNFAGFDELDKNTKESLQWFANWRMDFTTERRHELFGATLTPAEEKSWANAELIDPGMDAREIRTRINELQLRAEESLMRRANMSTASDLQSNRDVVRRGIGDLFAYDEDTNMYSAIVGEVEEASTAAGPVVEGEEVITELTPETKMAYAQMIKDFEPDVMARFQGIKDPKEQRRFLDFMYGG